MAAYEGTALAHQQLAEKQKSPTFTLDGEVIDLEQFFEDNEYDRYQRAALRTMGPGQSVTLGGGAGASFVLRCEGGGR